MPHTQPKQPHEHKTPTGKHPAVGSENRLEHLLKSLPAEKRRAYTQEIVRAVRKARGMPEPVFASEEGRIDKKMLLDVAERWQKKKGHRVMSHDKLVAGITATDMAVRLIKADVMKSVEGLGIGNSEKRVIEGLIDYRTQNIPGTNIGMRQDDAVHFIRLANELGQKKAQGALDALAKRAREIQKMAGSEEVFSKTRSDAFFECNCENRHSKSLFEAEMQDKADLAKRIMSIIAEKRMNVEKIRNTPHLKNKEHYELILNNQRKEAVIELMKFKINYKVDQ